MKRTQIGDILWLFVLLLITAFLIIPQTRQVFIQQTNAHPYLMGFIKFATLATMGELLAIRLAKRTWTKPVGFLFKVFVWGVVGILITFMFSFYSAGVETMLAPFNMANAVFLKFLAAFLTSTIMNLTFGIVFMGAHRISDMYIEMKVAKNRFSFEGLVKAIDWKVFITFVVGKTIPLFWIPAHTITFLLPPYLRVIVAAYLSILLGLILASTKFKKSV
jgi:hypothetical protein